VLRVRAIRLSMHIKQEFVLDRSVWIDAGASTTYQWKTTDTACNTPQCGLDGAQNGDSLVDPKLYPSVDFSAYPAQNACKALGGRLPTIVELRCISSNKASFGNNFQPK